MLRRIFALTLLACLFTVQANANTSSGLAEAFKSFQTKMDKWDMKAQEVYKSNLKQFRDAIKTEGVSDADLLEFAIAEIDNEKVANDLRTAYTLIKIENMEPQAAMKLITEKLAAANSSEQGANWAGTGVIIGIAAVALIVTVAVLASGGSVTVTPGGGGGCYDEYVCYDYYDDWGFYLYTDCWWETWCY